MSHCMAAVRHPPKRKPDFRTAKRGLRALARLMVWSDQHREPTVDSEMPPAPIGNTHMESVLHKLPQQIAFVSTATLQRGTSADRVATVVLLLCFRQDGSLVRP